MTWHAGLGKHKLRDLHVCLVCAVYFVQGILGLARLGVSFMYKDEFGLDPATVRTLPHCRSQMHDQARPHTVCRSKSCRRALHACILPCRWRS